jgi:glyoxylase-like metal-dependent hydrolase (beta-lactamase superfamily II)
MKSGLTALSAWLAGLLCMLFSVLPAQTTLRVERIEIDRDISRLYRFTQNAYLVYDPETRQALLIDPGKADKRISAFIKSNRLKVAAILNTHGHGDHTGGNRYFAKKYKAPVYAHAGDREMYRKPENIEVRQQIYFTGEAVLRIGSFNIGVLETPGHSQGSCCFLIEGHLFSGDTLVAGSIGKPAGSTPEEQAENQKKTIACIRAKLLILPDDTPVYPGHERSTTIGVERRRNRWLREEAADREE